jgi:beta-glucosidase
VDSPKEADAAIVFVESPLTDGYLEGEGYLPISLKYRAYTATTTREKSIAGGDFREADSNRSYYGKSNCAYNEADLDNILETKKSMQGKPVIVCIRVHNPMVVSEFETEVDAMLVEFGVEKRALLAILFGEDKPTGHLPIIMPKDMDTVECHKEDVFEDIEAYEDEMGNQYGFGFGLN